MVERLGGYMHLDSTLGSGTTAVLQLPVSAIETAPERGDAVES
jgi:signal transduction histidine kinase